MSNLDALKGDADLPLESVARIPKKTQLKMINILKKRIKDHETIKDMFEEYDIELDEIDLIPMGFEDLEVSARTDHGVIWLSYKLLQDGSYLEDDHYLVHEITHYLQQTTGDGPTEGGDKDYLDNEYEQEAFQYQTEYIADMKGEEVAEEYIDKVIEKHEVDDKEKESKKDELLGT